MRIRSKIILITFCYIMLFPVINSGFSAERPTMDEFIKGFTETKRILFDETPELILTCRLEKAELLDPADKIGPWNRSEWLLMRKGNIWRTEVRPLDEGENPDGHPWAMEPIIQIQKDGMWMNYKPHNTTVSVDRVGHQGLSVNIFREWQYFNRVGYGVAETIITSNKGNFKEFYDYALTNPTLQVLHSPDMPEYLVQNREKYILHDEPEIVDGYLCWVTEFPGFDKMWIDPEHGWAIRKRLRWYPAEKTREWELLNCDFKEVKPGLWLPMTQVETYFGYVASHPKEMWDKPLYRYTYKVSLSLDVVSERFDFSPPVGALVVDGIRKDSYRITAEGANPFAGPIAQGLQANRWVMFRAITIIIGSILVFIGLWLMLRRMEMRTKEG